MTLSSSDNLGQLTMVAVAAAVGATFSFLFCNNSKKGYGIYGDSYKNNAKYKIPSKIATSPLSEHAKLAVELALQAGANMAPYCELKGIDVTASGMMMPESLELEVKGTTPQDFCTQIDVENESLIMRGIKEKFPNHDIIGEETVGSGPIPRPRKQKYTWIIDPVDGTANFAAGLPLTCVSIGMCDPDGEPVLGVVFAPVLQELYIAVSGYGAYRNGMQLQSQTAASSAPATSLAQATVGFEFGYVREDNAIKAILSTVRRILVEGRCRAMRQIGCGVMYLMYLVCGGKFDAVYCGIAGESWKPWDLCAGYVFLKETDCLMETFNQSSETAVSSVDLLYSKHFICATNRPLMEELRKIILKEWTGEN